MHVIILDRYKRKITTSVELTVERFVFDVEKGGPAICNISATGSRDALAAMQEWLGGYVQVLNDNLTPVYWGKLDAVSTMLDGQRRTYTLSDVRNHVRTLFTMTDGEGVTFPMASDWLPDEDSIDNFGLFEEQRSIGEGTIEVAEAVRDRVLQWLKAPSVSFGLVRSGDEGSLRAGSLWDTWRQTYAYRPEGREVYMGEISGKHKIGFGFISDSVGFADKAMHIVNGGAEFLDEGDRFAVSGSTSNNGIKTLFMPVEGKAESYLIGDIAFNGIDDIDSVGGHLGFIRKGVFIHITGSDFNDRYHLTDNPGREHVTTDQNVTGDILTENGNFVTIKQGETLRISESITTEIPGATVTLKQVGEKVYYTFVNNSLVDWNVAEVWVRVSREGTPIDNLELHLYTSVAGTIATFLDDSIITGMLIPKRSTWVKFPFDNTVTLASGDEYAFALTRSGALSNVDFYWLDIDDTQSHEGYMGLWNGTSWESRPQGLASVPFQVWGHENNVTQLYKMLLQHNQYFAAIEVDVVSTLLSRQYRDGTSLVNYEAETLIDPGAETNRLRIRVTPEWRLIIDKFPLSGEVRYILKGRELLNRNGHVLEQGVLPVGEWCIVDGDLNEQAFMIGYLEYNVRSNEITDIKAIDALDPWNIMVRQG